ncbi:MAG: GHKL domain-containing protein [Lachnospiraceae bacterium]|nr:GHKL domain-containing protein [Lachnospiraceae bacterium]
MFFRVLTDILLYAVEGVTIGYAGFMLSTRFFGYPLKESGKRKYVLWAALAAYVLFGCIMDVAGILRGTHGLGDEFPEVNGLIFMVMIFYLPFQFNVKKRRGFLVSFFTEEVLMVVMTMLVALFCGLFSQLKGGNLTEIYIKMAAEVAFASLIGRLSALAGKRKKEPMSAGMMFSIFLVSLFMDGILAFLNPFYYGDLSRPILMIKVVFNGDKDAFYSFFILVIALILWISFLVIAVHDSEARYFQQKNLVSEYYLETQKEHYERQIEANQEMRRIRHDMKNHAYLMQELSRRKDYVELEKYLAELTSEMEQADTSVHVGNEIADAILSEKKQKAQRLGISLKVDGEMTGTALSALDTCTILANVLDNAIEAVDGLKAKGVAGEAVGAGTNGAAADIALSFRKNQNFLLISETNPAREDIKIEDGMIATTKKEKGNHGFGLASVRDAVSKYDGEVIITAEGGRFTIELMIPLTQ